MYYQKGNNMDENYFRDLKTLGKKRSENQITGESGIDIMRSLFPKEWVIREYTVDYGIDLDIELFEECHDGVYVTKGEHVLFQVKSTNDIEVKDLKVYSKTRTDILEHIYYKLDTLLNERKKTKTQLCKDTGISTNVVSKISKNEIFKTNTLNRICMSNQAKLKNM